MWTLCNTKSRNPVITNNIEIQIIDNLELTSICKYSKITFQDNFE